jgi:hypothetical protein
MNTNQSVIRDERTVAVENASYRWAFTFITFALLIDVVYRGAIRNEAAWDLLALACVPAIVCTMYQARQKILGHGWLRKMTLIACIAGVIAFIIAMILAITKVM